jgi:hypothetical protein
MPSHPIRPAGAGASAGSPRLLFRYVVVSLLFAVAVWFQIGAIRSVLRYVPVRVPVFVIATGSNVVQQVDSKASAAGLNRGDLLEAINGVPYTGLRVFIEQEMKAVAGNSLAVTVRSPEPASPDRIVKLPVVSDTRWASGRVVAFLLALFIPVFWPGTRFLGSAGSTPRYFGMAAFGFAV